MERSGGQLGWPMFRIWWRDGGAAIPLNPPSLPHFTPLGLSAAQSCLAAARAAMAPGSGLPQPILQQLAMLMPQQVRERGEQGGREGE